MPIRDGRGKKVTKKIPVTFSGEQHPMLMDDSAVIRRVLEGEVAMFELLMRRHNQQVYRAVRAVLRDEAEAEDAMQQAYLSAYRHLAQFHGEAKFSTWLTRIALNEALGRV